MFKDSIVRIREHLVYKGLCKTDIQRVGQSFSSLTLYYIGASAPRRLMRDHSKCDKDQCRALQNVGKGDEPRHANKDCQCGFSGPEREKIVEIIKNDSIPILHYSDETGLEVESYQPN